MATTYAIPDGRVAMAATLYTGTGAAQTISNAVNGVSFQPDFVWGKIRSGADYHVLTDSVRGNTKFLKSNTTDAEITQTQNITSFNSNGFTLGTNTDLNRSTYTFVGWQWKAGGTAVSNTSGSITSSVSANPTAGFSVVTYTGNATSGATVGHGLGVAPKMVIYKRRSSADSWIVYNSNIGTANNLVLNNTNAQAANGLYYWNSTAPTSTVFSLGNDSAVNASGSTYVAYCFAEVAGYSKFGSYTGNGSADGPFVYLGFRPRFVMIKSTGSQDWVMLDSSTNPSNVAGNYLRPNSSGAENGGSSPTTSTNEDFLSNGIKFRNDASSSGYTNGSGVTYIYMAFAEVPFAFANAR